MNTVSELQIVEEATYLIKKVIYSQKEDAVSSPFRTDNQKQLREKGAQLPVVSAAAGLGEQPELPCAQCPPAPAQLPPALHKPVVE